MVCGVMAKFHYADFPVTSATNPRQTRDDPLAQITLRRLPRTGEFRGSRRNGTWAGTSRVCRGRHGKVSIVKFGLYSRKFSGAVV